MYTPHPFPPPPARSSPVVWVLAAMGLMAILAGVLGTCGGIVAMVALSAPDDGQGGVLLGAQVPQETVAALRQRRLLGEGETLLAYHDATVRLDMSEVTFITRDRVVHANGATVAAAELAAVSRVSHRNEGLLGDVVDIVTDDGRAMRVAIAPLNGGESYVNVLEDAWQRQRRGSPPPRVERAAK